MKEKQLTNIKPIKYDGSPQVDRFIYGLDNILQYSGEKSQYGYLLGISGRAFNVVWDEISFFNLQGKEKESQVTMDEIHDFRTIKSALDACGYGFELVINEDRLSPNEYSTQKFSPIQKRELKDFVTTAIGHDEKPVLALMDLQSKIDWRIITGYSHDGNEISGWSGLQNVEYQDADLNLQKNGKFELNSYEDKIVLAIKLFGNKDSNYKEIQKNYYKSSLESVLNLSAPHTQENLVKGIAAYSSCLKALGQYEGDLSDDNVLSRLTYLSHVFLGNLASNRYYASEYLSSMRKGWNASSIFHAAGNCAKIHELVWDCWKIVGGYWRDQKKEIEKFKSKERRNELINIIKEIWILEQDTSNQIEIALDGWDKNHSYYINSK